MIDDDLPPWRRRELLQEGLEARQLAIALGDMMASCGLANLEIGQRGHKPRQAYRAGGYLVKAADYYLMAGMGRKAAAVSRLVELCRRAWLRHEAGEGFR